jgi:predicted Co/Zn/Cd cation transporter (cation efflux family)
MGRHISGDFDWKFTFAEQSSSFGEVLEKICKDLDDCYTYRYIGKEGQGEIVELQIDTPEEFEKSCLEYIGDCQQDFKQEDDEQLENYWNKVMMKKFLKENNWRSGDQLNFYVEY